MKEHTDINMENIEKIKSSISKELIKESVQQYLQTIYPQEDIIYALEFFDFQIKCKKKNQIRHDEFNCTKNELCLDSEILLAGGKKSSLYLRKVLTQDYYQKNANTTVSKLNKNGKYYWANPPIDYVDNDWILILNNVNERTLVVFEIPSKSINKESLYTRVKDGKVLIEMEIKANDSSYYCSTSHISYGQWFKEQIKY